MQYNLKHTRSPESRRGTARNWEGGQGWEEGKREKRRVGRIKDMFNA
jgi:hypothetical protein